MGGEALWQNSEYISPTKLRGKRYEQFLKKRVSKDKRKNYYSGVIEAGKKATETYEGAFEA